MGVLPVDTVEQHLVLGELALDGGIRAVAGVLPAAVAAAERGLGLICPAACGAEAAWLKDQVEILAAPSLLALINHARGTQLLTPPEPGRRRGRRRLSGPARRQGPGDRQARARDRRGRRPQPDAGGPAGRRQVDAGGAPDRHPAAAGPGRGARGQHDRQRRRPARRRPAVAAAAVPQPAPCGLDGGHGRRRQPGAARRDLAGPSGRAVPGRAARVRPGGAGIAAPAAGGGPDHGRPRPGAHDLPRPVPARRGDEPLPLRPSRRRRCWPARARRAAVPTTRRASPARCSTASTCMSRCRRSASPTWRCRRRARARPRSRRGWRPRASCRPTASPRPASPELRTNSEADGELLEAVAICDEPAHAPAASRRTAAASQRARLPSRPAGGPLDRRSRRQRDDPQAAHRRGDRFPPGRRARGHERRRLPRRRRPERGMAARHSWAMRPRAQ